MNNRFNPRTPCGVRPAPAFCPSSFLRFQSTHSLRSATPVSSRRGGRSCVSIHALLAECDCRCRQDGGLYTSFNPRTPCGVRRHRLKNPIKNQGFQSTHSLRSATSPLKESNKKSRVSIHALLAECDLPEDVLPALDDLFQSTHSLRSATFNGFRGFMIIKVSIHALLAECDRGQPPQQ